MYEARIIAKAFKSEENVSIGIIIRDKYRPLCAPVNDYGYPVAGRWTNNVYTPFNEMAIANLLLQDINENCDTFRRLDGFLEDHVGRVDAAKPFVDEFISTNDQQARKSIIERIKSVPGTEFYVKVMNRIMNEKEKKIMATIAKMEDMIHDENVNLKNRDLINKNLNVFKQFYPNYDSYNHVNDLLHKHDHDHEHENL